MKTTFTSERGIIYRANIRTYKTVARALKIAIKLGVNTLLAKDEDRETEIDYTYILQDRKQKLTSKAA